MMEEEEKILTDAQAAAETGREAVAGDASDCAASSPAMPAGAAPICTPSAEICTPSAPICTASAEICPPSGHSSEASAQLPAAPRRKSKGFFRRVAGGMKSAALWVFRLLVKLLFPLRCLWRLLRRAGRAVRRVAVRAGRACPPLRWLWTLLCWLCRPVAWLWAGVAWLCRRMGSVLVRSLRRYRIRRIDRYIITKFLSTYVFLIMIILLIVIIFDFNEKIDKFTQSHATVRQILLDYYLNFIPYFSNLFSPLFVFIAVIFFTSKLADNSEIIAMKSAGMSYRRLLRPYMFSAAVIALVTFLLGAYVIPRGNVARVDFENAYIKKKELGTEDNIQMQVDTGVVAYITHFDNRTKSGYGFSLDKFANKKLVSHLTAQTIQYDTLSDRKNSWTLRSYRIRTLKGMREKIDYGERLDTVLLMEPSDFFYTRGQQETMTLPELREFIARQRLRGVAGVSTFEVEYYKRFATPFAAFILTIIGVSLSCERRKGGGMGTSIGLGLALSFSYILFQTVSSSFAINAGWSPMFSVWLPNLLFALIAFFLYRRTPQ